MTDVGRNEIVRLEDDPRIDTFESHSAFARPSSFYLEDGPAVDHLSRHDHVVQTMPVPFDRTNRDDVDRVQHELMVQLGGAVDDHCVRHLLAAGTVPVEDVDVDAIDAWIRRSVLAVKLDTRTECGVDVLVDCELDQLVSQGVEQGDYFIEVGAQRCPVYGMARAFALDEPAYVLVAQQHVLALSSRVALFYSSSQLGREEYLSARCELAYAPRLTFHPGAVRIARVGLGGEARWRETVLAALEAP